MFPRDLSVSASKCPRRAELYRPGVLLNTATGFCAMNRLTIASFSVGSIMEERARAVLQECGAGFVHTHTIDRPWGVANSPLHGVEPDPFLEHDPSLDEA